MKKPVVSTTISVLEIVAIYGLVLGLLLLNGCQAYNPEGADLDNVQIETKTIDQFNDPKTKIDDSLGLVNAKISLNRKDRQITFSVNLKTSNNPKNGELVELKGNLGNTTADSCNAKLVDTKLTQNGKARLFAMARCFDQTECFDLTSSPEKSCHTVIVDVYSRSDKSYRTPKQFIGEFKDTSSGQIHTVTPEKPKSPSRPGDEGHDSLLDAPGGEFVGAPVDLDELRKLMNLRRPPNPKSDALPDLDELDKIQKKIDSGEYSYQVPEVNAPEKPSQPDTKVPGGKPEVKPEIKLPAQPPVKRDQHDGRVTPPKSPTLPGVPSIIDRLIELARGVVKTYNTSRGEAVGGYNSGKVRNESSVLSVIVRGVQKVYSHATGMDYATGFTTDLIRDVTVAYKTLYPDARFDYTHIGLKGGGYFHGHSSHQIGLEWDQHFIGQVGWPSAVVINNFTQIDPKFKTQENFDLFKLWVHTTMPIKNKLNSSVIQFIYVHNVVKKHFCQWAKDTGRTSIEDLEVLRHIQPDVKRDFKTFNNAHHDHTHIRLKCPKNWTDCKLAATLEESFGTTTGCSRVGVNLEFPKGYKTKL